jgi:hypothetical protein
MSTRVEEGSTTQDPPIKTHRGLLNLKKFESSFQASLDEAMANFSDDFLDSPVNTRQQRAVLKILSNSFQREIKAIYKDDPDLVQQCQAQRHLTENARKMIFGVYRADLPYYFATKIQSIEDERWRVFFTHRILLFHNHVSIKGKKNMGFDLIPVVDSCCCTLTFRFDSCCCTLTLETEDPYEYATARGYERKGEGFPQESPRQRQSC